MKIKNRYDVSLHNGYYILPLVAFSNKVKAIKEAKYISRFGVLSFRVEELMKENFSVQVYDNNKRKIILDIPCRF